MKVPFAPLDDYEKELMDGIPYQTLASSILQKYVEKKLNRI